jgi:hypothetical protein
MSDPRIDEVVSAKCRAWAIHPQSPMAIAFRDGVCAGLELAAEADREPDRAYDEQYVALLGQGQAIEARYWEGYIDARTDLRNAIRALASTEPGKGE